MQDAFIRLKAQFGITHVIETGTYHGVTTHWLAHNFDNVLTIESNHEHSYEARKLLHGHRNVEMWEGSSAERLGDMIEECEGHNLLVFLDAHWYENPVLDELRQIAELGATPVIVIHDFKNPGDPTMGYDEYPEQGIVYEWDWIKDKVDLIYGKDNYKYYYNRDATGSRRGCLFITPI